ncbi:MAG TPA: hypothetical protein VKD72_40035 [Gemmataceae bacterium]|nr:hypothetical protein [Gemmataceae bacterium]
MPGTILLGWTSFRSRVLLLGLVPVELDDFTLLELEPGRGFDECARLLTVRVWLPRRSVARRCRPRWG